MSASALVRPVASGGSVIPPPLGAKFAVARRGRLLSGSRRRMTSAGERSAELVRLLVRLAVLALARRREERKRSEQGSELRSPWFRLEASVTLGAARPWVSLDLACGAAEALIERLGERLRFVCSGDCGVSGSGGLGTVSCC